MSPADPTFAFNRVSHKSVLHRSGHKVTCTATASRASRYWLHFFHVGFAYRQPPRHFCAHFIQVCAQHLNDVRDDLVFVGRAIFFHLSSSSLSTALRIRNFDLVIRLAQKAWRQCVLVFLPMILRIVAETASVSFLTLAFFFPLETNSATVDTKGMGQPFMMKKKKTADQNFDEWTHKVRTFMLGRFGDHRFRLQTFAEKPQDTLD